MFRPATRPEEISTPETTADLSGADETQPAPADTTAGVTQETAETKDTAVLEHPVTTSVSFVGAGDNIVYYGNVRDAASCKVEGGRSYNFKPTYDRVASIVSEADVAFINQETLMCGDGYDFSYYPRFNGPQDLGYDLAEIGFDVVNIANNHMLDKGAAGLGATIDFWNTVDGVTLLGGYKNMEDYDTIRHLTVNDITIAFLSYTFFTNFLTLPQSSELVVPYPDEETVLAQLESAHETADYVIVSVHWGDENSFTPNDEQRNFASLLADGGADVILGHHPHVIQPIEWIAREDGGQTLCVYSLGNFMAEMPRDYNMLGGLISFDIVKCGESVTTENVEFLPTVYYFTTSFYRNCVYPITEFTDDMAASHGLAYYGRSISLDTVYSYLYSTIGDSFLPEDLRKNENQ